MRKRYKLSEVTDYKFTFCAKGAFTHHTVKIDSLGSLKCSRFLKLRESEEVHKFVEKFAIRYKQ